MILGLGPGHQVGVLVRQLLELDLAFALAERVDDFIVASVVFDSAQIFNFLVFLNEDAFVLIKDLL